MTLLPRLCLLIALSGLVAACQTGTQGQGPGDVTPNAVAGDAIEVTALDEPLAEPAPTSTPTSASALTVAPEQSAAPPPAPEDKAAVAAPVPDANDPVEATGAGTDAGTAAEAEAPAEIVQEPKSKSQIACERKRGTWASTEGGLRICILPTRDGGQRCTRESQCEGVCLARSGTCAPAEPLLGCNDILQDNGVRATQCIE